MVVCAVPAEVEVPPEFGLTVLSFAGAAALDDGGSLRSREPTLLVARTEKGFLDRSALFKLVRDEFLWMPTFRVREYSSFIEWYSREFRLGAWNTPLRTSSCMIRSLSTVLRYSFTSSLSALRFMNATKLSISCNISLCTWPRFSIFWALLFVWFSHLLRRSDI